MADYDTVYGRGLFLSPDQQGLLLTALASADHKESPRKHGNLYPPTSTANINGQTHERSNSLPVNTQYSNSYSTSQLFESPVTDGPDSGHLGLGTDESPFLDFDLDPDFDPSGTDALIGDIPGVPSNFEEYEPRDKRKSIDGKDDDESGKKRKEGDEKTSKKPGRKPLTSEPTSKRKAQNRAAQRAFRERKEKHLKDLENKVEDLEKVSEATNNENSLLRAQVDRLQVEVREYRKRLSWVNRGNSLSSATNHSPRNFNFFNGQRANGNDFSFDFPKFGDLPGSHMFNNESSNRSRSMNSGTQLAQGSNSDYKVPGILNRNSVKPAISVARHNQFSNGDRSPTAIPNPSGDGTSPSRTSVDSGLDRKPMLYDSLGNLLAGKRIGYVTKAARSSTYPRPNQTASDAVLGNTQPSLSYGGSASSNSNSPSASSESQPAHLSSIGTSPEPSATSPSMGKPNDIGSSMNGTDNANHSLQDSEKDFYEKLNEACGCADNPVPPALSRLDGAFQPFETKSNPVNNNDVPGIDWLAQQNGGQFDPVLFGDYREPQDAILTQDFGSFFNDAFPLPDLGSPLHNFNDLNGSSPAKKDLITQIDERLAADDDEEVVPGEDTTQMLTCTKIWDRLQSMDKFRNGEIDVDSLCTELRTKARCSEGGVVVNQRDVEEIMNRAE